MKQIHEPGAVPKAEKENQREVRISFLYFTLSDVYKGATYILAVIKSNNAKEGWWETTVTFGIQLENTFTEFFLFCRSRKANFAPSICGLCWHGTDDF